MTKGKNILPRGQRGGGEGARSTPALWRRTACQHNAFTQPDPRLERGKATDTPRSHLICYEQMTICPSLHVQRRAKEEPVLLYSMCINIYDHTQLRTSPGGKNSDNIRGSIMCACSLHALQLEREPWHLRSHPVQPLSHNWVQLWRNVLCQLRIVLLHSSYIQSSCLPFLPAR